MAHHQQLLDWIENELINQNLHLGDELPSDRVLAREVGISQNLMRESLKHCEEIGVLRLYEGRKKSIIGVLLREPASSAGPAIGLYLASSRTPHQDLLNTCLLLESYALSGQSIDKSAIPKLEQIVASMQDAGTSLIEFHDLEADFHIQLGRLSGNVLVSALLATLRDAMVEARFELVDRVPLWSDTSARLRMEYRAIADAIRSGDYALAQTLLRANLSERFAEAGHHVSLSEDRGQDDEGAPQFILEPVDVDVDAHGLVPDAWSSGAIEPELFRALSTIQPIKAPAPSKKAKQPAVEQKASADATPSATGSKAQEKSATVVAQGKEPAGRSPRGPEVTTAKAAEPAATQSRPERPQPSSGVSAVPRKPQTGGVKVAEPATVQSQPKRPQPSPGASVAPKAPNKEGVKAAESAPAQRQPERTPQPSGQPVASRESVTPVKVAGPTIAQKQLTPPKSVTPVRKRAASAGSATRKRRGTVSPVIRATVIPPRQTTPRPAQTQQRSASTPSSSREQLAPTRQMAVQSGSGAVGNLEAKIRREEARLSALNATDHAQDAMLPAPPTEILERVQPATPSTHEQPAKASPKKLFNVVNYFGFKQIRTEEPIESSSIRPFSGSGEGKHVSPSAPGAERPEHKPDTGHDATEPSADRGHETDLSDRQEDNGAMKAAPWKEETLSTPHESEAETPHESTEELSEPDSGTLETAGNLLGQKKGKRKPKKNRR